MHFRLHCTFRAQSWTWPMLQSPKCKHFCYFERGLPYIHGEIWWRVSDFLRCFVEGEARLCHRDGLVSCKQTEEQNKIPGLPLWLRPLASHVCPRQFPGAQGGDKGSLDCMLMGVGVRFQDINGRKGSRPWPNCGKKLALKPSVTCALTSRPSGSTTASPCGDHVIAPSSSPLGPFLLGTIIPLFWSSKIQNSWKITQTMFRLSLYCCIISCVICNMDCM